MKKYSVHLHTPCNEDWNQMTSKEQGRHCNHCNKTVVDFSAMSDAEMINYLLNHQNVCGRVKPQQINRTIQLGKSLNKTHWPAIAAMLIAGLVNVVPTNLQAASYQPPMVQTDTTNHSVDPEKSKAIFYIYLFDENTRKKVYNGSVMIKSQNSFFAQSTGEIIIENIATDQAYIEVTLEAPGYEPKEYRIQLKDFKNKNSIEVYLKPLPVDRHQMMNGGISLNLD
jgi:hypothetical protein